MAPQARPACRPVALAVPILVALARPLGAGAFGWPLKSPAGDDDCASLEPLQVTGEGKYALVSSGRPTTCSELSGGQCPVAVNFPGSECLISCIANGDDCATYNSQTPSVGHIEKHRCFSCGIKACKACDIRGGETTCKECFDGFVLADGKCELWNRTQVVYISEVVGGAVALLLVFALVGTLFAALHMRDRAKKIGAAGGRDSVTLPLLTGQQQSPEEERKLRNKTSIKQGLMYSLLSSIKWSQMENAKQKNIWKRLMDAMVTIDKEMGLGFQLFFNTQGFLVAVAAVMWGATYLMTSARVVTSEFDDGGQCPSNITSTQMKTAEARILYATVNGYGCACLWLALLTLTWLFHAYQRKFIMHFDNHNTTAEDYTLRLDNLPRHITSEQKLKEILEKEFKAAGQIHGVSICYAISALEEEISKMVEHLVEFDDRINGWSTDSDGSMSTEMLKILMQEDKEKLQNMILKGELQGSGRAYVVFKDQRSMLRVFTDRKAFASSVFYANDTPAPGDVEKDIVIVSHTSDEPSGVRWYDFYDLSKPNLYRKYLPVRMLVYILIYAAGAHLYYIYMLKYYNDNYIEGADQDLPVKLVAKAVLGLNFAIQTVIMVDVEKAKLRRTAMLNNVTFIWNSVLLLITTGYLIVAEACRAGIEWDLTVVDPSAHPQLWWQEQRTALLAASVENDVGRHMLSLLQEQLVLLYVVGEVANVMMPVMFMWLALRISFVWNAKGTKSRLQKGLRGLLPNSYSEHLVTPREAERAQVLMPLFLWMEYTYVIVFIFIAMVQFYIVTDQEYYMCKWLFIFSCIFFFWQRYVMLWLYGKSSSDSAETYVAFMKFWGVVLSMLPPATAWWAGRLRYIMSRDVNSTWILMAFVMAGIYALAMLIYLEGLRHIDQFLEHTDNDEDVNAHKDYVKVMTEQGSSWWNHNPVYVLKHRHCADLKGHECHPSAPGDPPCWPRGQRLRGFYEAGKDFRQVTRAYWDKNYSKRSTHSRSSFNELLSGAEPGTDGVTAAPGQETPASPISPATPATPSALLLEGASPSRLKSGSTPPSQVGINSARLAPPVQSQTVIRRVSPNSGGETGLLPGQVYSYTAPGLPAAMYRRPPAQVPAAPGIRNPSTMVYPSQQYVVRTLRAPQSGSPRFTQNGDVTDL